MEVPVLKTGKPRAELLLVRGGITKEFIEIVLAKCDERKRMGYDNLTDSDVIDVTREDLKRLGMD